MPQGLQLTSSDTAALFSIDWLQVTGRVAIFKVLGKNAPVYLFKLGALEGDELGPAYYWEDCKSLGDDNVPGADRACGGGDGVFRQRRPYAQGHPGTSFGSSTRTRRCRRISGRRSRRSFNRWRSWPAVCAISSTALVPLITHFLELEQRLRYKTEGRSGHAGMAGARGRGQIDRARVAARARRLAGHRGRSGGRRFGQDTDDNRIAGVARDQLGGAGLEQYRRRSVEIQNRGRRAATPYRGRLGLDPSCRRTPHRRLAARRRAFPPRQLLCRGAAQRPGENQPEPANSITIRVTPDRSSPAPALATLICHSLNGVGSK